MEVLMLPWLAHGHVSSFLELAKRLVTRDFHIYICSTPVNLQPIKKKIAEKYSTSIDLVELHLPSSPELPPHYHTTNGLPPHLIPTLKTAYETSGAPEFSNILSTLHPDLVIYDFNQPWAAEIASSQNIPAVQFLSVSTCFVCYGLHMAKNYGKKFPFPEIYFRDYEMMQKKQDEGEVLLTDAKDRDDAIQALERSYKIVLVKSFRELEGKFLDLFSTLSNKTIIPVGPLVQDVTTDSAEDREEDIEITEWLDKKEKGSVIYASFGSEYFLTKEERRAVSVGLELSNVNFIWVLRFPTGEKISVEEALPEGFLKRVGDRGKIVQGWAPQAKILKHSSTGAFLSHCGLNSVMESMKWGVPIVALPMQIDQPLNARLLEAAGVGIEAVRDSKGNLQSEEIARVIRQVLVEEIGEDVRRKAKEMSHKLEIKGDEEIDNVVEALLGLLDNKQ